MRRVNPESVRRAALTAALCASASACTSSAKAPSRGATAGEPSSAAVEWAGMHVEETSPAAAAPAAAKEAWVLHIGDSFTEAAFQQNLGPRFRAAGTRYVVDAVTATYTTTWAHDPDLDRWLARRPALVLVTLGANEFDIPVPAIHARAVEAIARKIASAGASCVWVAPPMWKQDSGILGVIYEHCAPCIYVDSDALLGGLSRGERQPDNIHPNKRGGARWAEAFWGWLMDHRDPDVGPWAIMPFERRANL